MKVSRNARRARAAIVLALVAVIVLFALMASGAPPVLAQATNTPTPTNTPTNTPTKTPTLTPTTTPFPVGGNALIGNLLCRFSSVDCVQSRGGGGIHLYGANGALNFGVNGATGAVTAKSLTVSGALAANSIAVTTPMAVLAYQTPGVRIKCGTDTITGTLAIAHGMATPQYVNANLGADVNGDHARVSFTNASATVTIKVWNSALTPAAAQTPVAVDWCVVGVP